jgi:sugar/nucleoside kinase (ribokinase family)
MDVLCVGEMVIDFIPGKEPASYIRNAGGAPANVAIAIARNGLKAGFCGKLGNDDFGHFLAKTLEENQVKLLCGEYCQEAITTMAFVTLQENGERAFTFARKPGADMFLTENDVKKAGIESANIVHAGSCSLSKEPAASATVYALKSAHAMGKLVSFDVNYRNLMWEDNREAAAKKVLEILPYVDFLKISEEEVDMVGGDEHLFQLMKDNQIVLVMKTLGSKGAECYFNGRVLKVRGRKAKAVDATGAGDAFWGGFLSSLLIQESFSAADLTAEKIQKAMDYGNVAGWICVQAKGAISSLPTRAQVESFLSGGAN